jgi:hypothetical protein
MNSSQSVIGRSLVSGTAAALATTVAASLAGKRETAFHAAPLNATSHMVWGDEAARHDRTSLKYTAVGYLLHHGASIFWAAVYEKWFAPSAADSRGQAASLAPLRPLAGAAVTAALAYVTDYHVVPRRLSPGFEMRLSGKSLAVIYGTLALGLAASSMMRMRRQGGNFN